MHDTHNFEKATSDYFPALKSNVNSVKEETLSKSFHIYDSPEQSESKKLKPPVMKKKMSCPGN